jgi:hypothetical protein
LLLLEVTVLFSGGDVFVVVPFVVVLLILFFGVCSRVVCGLSGFEGDGCDWFQHGRQE